MASITTAKQTHGVPVSTLCQSLSLPRAGYYRSVVKRDEVARCPVAPNNALSNEQRQEIVALLHSQRFVDCTPYQVYYTLLDEGRYYGSISTLVYWICCCRVARYNLSDAHIFSG
mgnify:CR=1 FL=1